MYVEKLDYHRSQDPSFVCDSNRKIKSSTAADVQDDSHENAQDSTTIEQSLTAEVKPDEEPEDSVPDTPVEDSNEPLDILMGDVLRGYNALCLLMVGPLEAISVPCIREGNSLTLCSLLDIGDQLVVFGGRILRDISILVSRAVRTNLCSSNERDTQPRERSDHSALFMAPQHLLIFGGRGRNGQVFRDFFALSLELWHWTQLDTSVTPYERYWHGWCIAFDTEQPWQQEPSIFLFGGKSDTLVYSDLHQLQTSRLKRLLADEEEHERKYTRSEDGETTAQRQLERKVSDAARVLERQRPPAWFVPNTVGKPPSARFGMQVVALENEQLTVVGGWRITKNKADKPRKSRSLDVHILDLTTLVWSTPRLSTLVTAQPYVPSERLLFECFYVHQTLVFFGGHTYASNGETESFTACEDASTVLYKLDVSRMIWRRQKFPVAVDDAAEDVITLPLAHSHCSNNAVLSNGRSFSCSSETDSVQLQLTAFDIRAQLMRHV
ncbi:Kelch-type beta propeller [Phytophthora cactorum]|nr:Kelch-type beta propeller [Phytophthora cactorum]